MNILVTGGAGYIGSHACIELLNEGYNVVVIDNLSNSKLESISRVKLITSKSLDFVQADLQDYDSVRKLFSQYKIDAVMHFAGLKAVAESVDNPLLYYTNNLTSTFILCRVMSEFKVKIMVFSSSATVYGSPASLPVSEDALLKAYNPYGQTKLMIEKFLSDLYKADNAWKIIILRYFNPIGAHSSGLIGENPIGTPNNLLPYISQVAIGRRKILSIYGNDYSTTDGTCIRDYIHVVDLVKGHTKALNYLLNETDMKDFKNTAINLGIGRGYSVLEILKAFEKTCDFSIKYQYVERRQGDVPEIYSNPALAQQLLGWKAQFGIQEMCSDAWNWQMKNPNGFDD